MDPSCEFCGECPSDCRCLDICPACGIECACETEPPRFDQRPPLVACVVPDTERQSEQYLSVWGGRVLREALPK